MRKLALKDEYLLRVEKPARYIGNEINSVQKDKEKIAIRMALCFPDVYEIGMSHLGIQILYDMINSWDDVWCERVYSPWADMDRIMREASVPLFALESQDPIREFDFLGITIQFELCYTNILQILDLSGIPFYAGERTETDPIVIGGGPCTYNPEPIADFFDLFYIGEGETRYRELLDCYREIRSNGGSRMEFLLAAARIPGIYVPRFYQTEYNDDGTISLMKPLIEGIPARISKEIVDDISQACYPLKPVVPFIKTTQDRVTLELQRGCLRGCRFCQAGYLYRPVRERDVAILKEYAISMLANTGYEEISLSSLSSSDYSGLAELIDFLITECKSQQTNISLPSLRIDAFSLDVMSKVQDVKKSSLTFAPEAGSQKLRNIINKGLTEEMILAGAGKAFEAGWSRVKLYFMLGLPAETESDIAGIGELANRIAAVYYETVPKEKRNGKVQIVVSTSFFIPKPFTPFQWAPQATKEEFLDKAYLTRKAITTQLNQKSIKYNWHETDSSVLECVLARGDRRLAPSILAVYRKGCIFDAWSEHYRHDVWLETLKENNVDIAFYTTRARADDEIFPWDFIDVGVSKEYLLKEWHKARSAPQETADAEELITPNCREQCQGCGAASFRTGICVLRG